MVGTTKEISGTGPRATLNWTGPLSHKEEARWPRLRARVRRMIFIPALRLRLAAITYACTQRLVDIVVSLIALVISAPLIVAVALLIKGDSPGPVIFKHRRIGMNRRRTLTRHYAGKERRQTNQYGRPFILYKFRSMYVNSRELFPELYAYSYSADELARLPIKSLVGMKRDVVGASYYKDPRLTRMGAWLRKTSLDELPNFINVLKGDMHLVGPRPDIAENIRYYSPTHMKKLEVKPGLTGLAQIKGRGDLSFIQTNNYDVEYVNNRSLLLDLKILVQTIAITLRAKGAY